MRTPGRDLDGVTEMDVRLLTVARYAEGALDATSTIIGAGWDLWSGPALPVTLPQIFFVAKLALDRDDIQSPHTVQMRVLAPTGETLFATDRMDVPVSEIPQNRDFLTTNLVFGLQHLAFPAEGFYRFQLLYDDRPSGEAPFRVEVAPPDRSEDGRGGL